MHAEVGRKLLNKTALMLRTEIVVLSLPLGENLLLFSSAFMLSIYVKDCEGIQFYALHYAIFVDFVFSALLMVKFIIVPLYS